MSPVHSDETDAAGGARVLVIDDSPTLLKLVEATLTRRGFTVTMAADRPPGEALTADRPQLVLLGTAGDARAVEALFAAIRAAQPPVPVVLMGSETGVEASPPGEVIDFIKKPFAPDALVAVVSHALDSTRDPAAPRPASDLGSLSLVPTETTEVDRIIPESWPAGLALAGDLGVISLADVLGLLDAEAQTGVLSIQRADARLRVHFHAGRIDLATAEGVPEEFLLGRFLVRGGALAAPTLASALETRAALPEGQRPLLGKFLVDRGFVGLPALQRVLALQTAALVFESLRWGAGRFGFEATAARSELAEDAALGLGVPALLLEGFRRVDEWRLIEREVGDFDRVFLRDEERLAGFGRGRLTREEQSVLELCDGRRTVREIIDRSQLGAFDTTKMLYRLSRTRLIRRRVAPVATPA